MIRIVISGQVYSSVYTNKRLIKESKPIINEIRKVIQRVLKDGKAYPGQIKDIIMVGGSSKMPSSDYQTRVHFTILQGEEMYAKDNTMLGSIDVKITPKPKNMEHIIARYTYDINGILIVDIKVPSTGKNYQKILSESLSEGELKSRMEKLNKMRTDPKDLPENMELIERLEQIHAEVSLEQKQAVIDMIDIFGKALSSGSPVGIVRARRMNGI